MSANPSKSDCVSSWRVTKREKRALLVDGRDNVCTEASSQAQRGTRKRRAVARAASDTPERSCVSQASLLTSQQNVPVVFQKPSIETLYQEQQRTMQPVEEATNLNQNQVWRMEELNAHLRVILDRLQRSSAAITDAQRTFLAHDLAYIRMQVANLRQVQAAEKAMLKNAIGSNLKEIVVQGLLRREDLLLNVRKLLCQIAAFIGSNKLHSSIMTGDDRVAAIQSICEDQRNLFRSSECCNAKPEQQTVDITTSPSSIALQISETEEDSVPLCDDTATVHNFILTAVEADGTETAVTRREYGLSSSTLQCSVTLEVE